MKKGMTLGRRCTALSCTRKHYGKGYCVTHYHQWIKHGAVTKIREWASYPKSCQKCGKPSAARGYCSNHYQMLRRHGKPEPIKPSYPGWTRPERRRHWHYGLTREEFAELLEHQNNACAICWRPFQKAPRSITPFVDHDHKTGFVRGLLCQGCNMALGHIERYDVPGVIFNEYLDVAAQDAEDEESA